MNQPLVVQTNDTPVGVDNRPPLVVPEVPPFPDLTDLSLAAAQRRSLITAIFEAAWRNWDLKARYLSRFADYVTNMTSGHTLPPEQQVPPPVPFAFAVHFDGTGMAFVDLGSAPVCEMPPMPYYAAGNKVPTPTGEAVFDMGPAEPSLAGWFKVGPDDTEPTGFTKKIPGPNGPMIVKKVKIPFGAYYEMVTEAR